jgi:O-methyltransferase
MKEIRRASVLGNVAELGVNRGDFASVLNRLFPDRMLYLFDTFEGFSPKDIETEKAHRFSKASPRHFRRTSVDIVMKKMKHPEKCIIKKGFFPDTAKGLEDRFCFVNLDADLYDPILSGLQYFYPRLEKGGFILVHDYNHDMYKGAGAAVRDFCKETGVAFIPLPDGAGSAIIAK